MQLRQSDKKTALQNRLNRIEGQIRGINSMVQNEINCHEVLRQLTAVRASIQSTTRFFLESVVAECEAPGSQSPMSQKEITNELLELIAKS
jgi:DNA-binding FrmR family transcriptional regulator